MKNLLTPTGRRRLCETGLYGRITVKKLLLRKQNNFKRPQWTKSHKDWTIEQWNKVLWTDESKFEIFLSNTRVYVWRRLSERAANAYITPTVKHGWGSIMVWWRGAFAYCKVGDLDQVKGKLNQTGYHSILKHYIIPPGTPLMAQGFVLMQGNDQNIRVILGRGTLKANRNSTSFNWCWDRRSQWN